MLHVARQARLRQQRRVGLVEILEQRLLHRGNVVDALGDAACELLKTGEAVELQRIEGLRRFVHHARLDLRVRVNLNFAHLRAQSDHAVRELEQITFEGPKLSLDAGTGDSDFTCFVDEPVDQIGAHAQHRARRFDISRCCRRFHRLDRLRGHGYGSDRQRRRRSLHSRGDV